MKQFVIAVLLILMCLFLWSMGDTVTSKPVEKPVYALGDTGIPANYNVTMKEFKNSRNDYQVMINSLEIAFDWRTRGMVTPSKDQGLCGSCWAFAAVATLESKMLMNGFPEYDLSEQQQISCNTTVNGCLGGNMATLMFWYTTFPMQEICTGYAAANLPCSNYSTCSVIPVNTAGYYTVNTRDINEMKVSLRIDGPTYIRYDVYTDFFTFWDTYDPGKVYIQSSGSLVGGHAVELIGWDDRKQAWLCKNSWGEFTGPNGDGTFWIAYSGHTHSPKFAMANITLKSGVGTFMYSGTWANAGTGNHKWFTGDFNGDRKTDLLRHSNDLTGAEVFLSTGTAFNPTGTWTNAASDEWYTGDFNGDGKEDIFGYLANASGLQVYLSTGSSFVYSGIWGNANYGENKWYTGDFNGDGKTDIFRYRNDAAGVEVFLSTGYSFVFSGSWSTAGADDWYVGDFNGDRKDDIFRYRPYDYGPEVYLSNGTSFVYNGTWMVPDYGETQWYVGDFNGDGKDDIFRHRTGYSGAEVFLSNGYGFVLSGSWTGPDVECWYPGDFNGDTRVDLFRYVQGVSGVEVFLSR